MGDPAAGRDRPGVERTSTTWAGFLRSQADALLACDFFETVTLTGARLYVLAVIEHSTRRIRILGVTPHPAASWVAQAAKNLVMDLEVSGARARFLIRDRDGKFPGLFDAVLRDAGLEVVLSWVQMPRMKRSWNGGCRPAGTSSWTACSSGTSATSCTHREFEQFYNQHQPHRTLRAAAPSRPLPEPMTDPEQIAHLDVRDRLGGTHHEYQHAA